MYRIKSNKAALILFIATIAMLVLGVVGIIFTITGINPALEEARKQAIAQGGDQPSIDLAVNIVRISIYITIVISAILLLFEVLCGLKCSMYGRWRTGAIVFGVLLCVNYGWGITQGGWQNWVNLALAIFYLVGAILCKPGNSNTASAE